jgi:hypothetical protein
MAAALNVCRRITRLGMAGEFVRSQLRQLHSLHSRHPETEGTVAHILAVRRIKVSEFALPAIRAGAVFTPPPR